MSDIRVGNWVVGCHRGDLNGIELRLARVDPELRTVLAADGVEDCLGGDQFHANFDEAVAAAPNASAATIGSGSR